MIIEQTADYQTIQLTASEMMLGAQVGVMRQVQNVKKKRRNSYGAAPKIGWQIHIEGALGECAVAKLFSVYWSGYIGNLNAGDVGAMEVRTRSNHKYELIIHPKDKDGVPFIHVTGRNGRYRIHGWIYAEQGKHKEYWKDPAGDRPAFFVPYEKLNPIESIIERLQSWPELFGNGGQNGKTRQKEST